MGNESPGLERQTGARIKTVKTTFVIIEAVKQTDDVGVTELADRTGLAKSTVHKHLASLREEGYVIKDGDTYQLSTKFLDLGGHVREKRYDGANIKTRIKELAEDTEHVAHFAVEEDGRAVVLYREGGQNDLPTRSRVGKRMYLHQTAYGKSILAHLPEERVAEVIDQQPLPEATENTVGDPESLREQLAEVRERGYAVNDEESTKGLLAIGAPVLLNDNTVFGACSIAGPVSEVEDDIVDKLLKATKKLELEITYS